jgi:hypothetical protein
MKRAHLIFQPAVIVLMHVSITVVKRLINAWIKEANELTTV